MSDIPKALIVALLLALLAAGLWSQCSEAGEWQPPELELDARYSEPPAPECHRSGWIGALSLYAPYSMNRYVRAGPHYEHNSCLKEEHDRADSDAIGIKVRIILGD